MCTEKDKHALQTAARIQTEEECVQIVTRDSPVVVVLLFPFVYVSQLFHFPTEYSYTDDWNGSVISP